MTRRGDRFLLPLRSGKRVDPQQSEPRNILVVEDDPAIRRLITLVLRREGFRVDEATDGVEAVLKIGVVTYDVIVLDLMMPNLDGFSLISTLAEADPDRLRSVIVTSAASPGVIRDRMHGMPFAVVPKPFEVADLVERVKACAGRGDAGR